MEVHGGVENGVVFAFPTNRRNDDGFRAAASGEAFLDRMCQRRMGAKLQPNVDAEVGNRINGRRELNRLPDPPRPVGRVTSVSVEAVASDGAEERNRFRLRGKVGQRILERVRRRLHHRVMKWMIDSNEPCKNALGFELSEDGLDRVPWTSEGEGTWPVERRDRYRPVVLLN